MPKKLPNFFGRPKIFFLREQKSFANKKFAAPKIISARKKIHWKFSFTKIKKFEEKILLPKKTFAGKKVSQKKIFLMKKKFRQAKFFPKKIFAGKKYSKKKFCRNKFLPEKKFC